MAFDLLETPVLGLMGGKPTDRNNFIKVVANHLDGNIFSCPVEFYVVDDIQHSLKWMESKGITKKYTANPSAVLELLEQLSEKIKERFDIVVENGIEALQTEPLLILLIQNRESINAIGKDPASMALYKELLGTYRSMRFCIFLTDLEDAAVSFSAPEILKMVKENRNFIYFNKLSNIKFIDVPLATIRRFKKDLEENDAYWITAENIEKVRIVSS
jgi:S-DNA-T family DNA segregation ATPase FtsK/SpoIIIE